MYYFLPKTLAVALLVLAMATGLAARDLAVSKPTQAEGPSQVLTIEGGDEGGGESLVGDQFVLAIFKYNLADHKIYVSKRFFTDKGGLANLSAQDQSNFGSYQFYVYPTATLTRQDLTQAFDSKRAVGDRSSAGGQMFETTLRVTLVNDGFREAAAAAINAMYPHARVSKTNIAIVSYRYLEVSGDLGDGMTRLGAWPGLDTSTLAIPKMANTPNELQLKIVGDADRLQKFCQNPRLEGRFILGGYHLNIDVMNFSMNMAVKLGLHHILSGDANWSELHEIDTQVSKGAVGQGIEGKRSGAVRATSQSWVTRSQVRRMSTTVRTAVMGISIIESQSNPALENLAGKIAEQLLRDSSADQEFKIIDQGKEFVLDPALVGELGADRYQDLNVELKAAVAKKQSTAQESAEEAESQKSNDNSEWMDADEITWTIQGTRIVPKSIKLYQFNNDAFAKYWNWSYMSATAKRATDQFEIPAAVGPFGLELKISRFRFVNVADDDEDLKGFGVIVDFLDENGVSIPGTHWDLRRGETDCVGDLNRHPSGVAVNGTGGDANFATDFFIGETRRIQERVSKVHIKVWAATDDGGTPGEWQPFEMEFAPVDGGEFSFHGGWVNGSTLDTYHGRHIEVCLTTKEL